MIILVWLQRQVGAFLGWVIYEVLLDLWNYITGRMAAAKQEQDQIQKENQAVDQASAATTPEGAWDAQDQIIKNSPQP